ncbi:MAG: hypothetical protein JOY52_11425 [Hyphomicrobiales bacterium]|nr:hypothetical protein [Hyphomicrobiales bacterium]
MRGRGALKVDGFASADPFARYLGSDEMGKDMMVVNAMTRRGALAVLGEFGLSTLAASSARAQRGLRFGAVVVNVGPLRALMGDPTAAWMEQALAQALPRALGAHLAPGDRNAPVLEVQIDWIYLAPSPGGPGPRGSAQDTIVGSFIVRGPRGGIEAQIPLRAIASYYPNAVDQALVAEANHWRIIALAQAFAGWAPRELGL